MSQDLTALVAHYTDASEKTRLTSPWGQLEFQRTQALLKQHLPPPPATIVDVGGGAGAYSLWLASEGYAVHLIDPVPKHVEQALEASHQTKRPLKSVTVGDARSLSQSDDSIDAVLLLGPLYHLFDRADRVQALSEAYRVLRPSGVVFAAGISRFASALDGLWRKLLDDPDFVPIVQRDLKDGQHRNATNNLEYFTDAFFHLPQELRLEVEEAGFVAEALSAIEGPAWLLPDLSIWLNGADRHQILMTILAQIESQESLMGTSSHFMSIGRKVTVGGSISLLLKDGEIRNWRKEDVLSLVQNANDKEIWSKLRDVFPYPYTPADAQQWIKIANAAQPTTNFAIVVDGCAVGGIGLTLQGDISRKSAEVGYWLGRRYWGRGITTEALIALTKYGFENFDLSRMYALPFDGNAASIKVLEKAGYQCEGKLRKAVIKEGRILDQLLYSIIRE